MKPKQLSQSTIEKLGYYVYLLIDPRNNKVFYVGKGVGNRINQHLLGALDLKTKESDKINTIRDIRKAGKVVKHIVLRHELTEKEAFEVESAVIDLLGKENLTNIVKGHNAEDKGIMTLEDIKIKYEAEDAIIDEPMILINIKNLYKRDMTAEEMYEATRKSWRISMTRVKNISYACAVYKGIIREVFKIDKWLPSSNSKGRFMFVGKVATAHIRNKYINKSVAKYWIQGSQNPIKYVE